MSERFTVEWIPDGLVGPPHSIAGVVWTFATREAAIAWSRGELAARAYLRGRLYLVTERDGARTTEVLECPIES